MIVHEERRRQNTGLRSPPPSDLSLSACDPPSPLDLDPAHPEDHSRWCNKLKGGLAAILFSQPLHLHLVQLLDTKALSSLGCFQHHQRSPELGAEGKRTAEQVYYIGTEKKGLANNKQQALSLTQNMFNKFTAKILNKDLIRLKGSFLCSTTQGYTMKCKL